MTTGYTTSITLEHTYPTQIVAHSLRFSHGFPLRNGCRLDIKLSKVFTMRYETGYFMKGISMSLVSAAVAIVHRVGLEPHDEVQSTLNVLEVLPSATIKHLPIIDTVNSYNDLFRSDLSQYGSTWSNVSLWFMETSCQLFFRIDWCFRLNTTPTQCPTAGYFGKLTLVETPPYRQLLSDEAVRHILVGANGFSRRMINKLINLAVLTS